MRCQLYESYSSYNFVQFVQFFLQSVQFRTTSYSFVQIRTVSHSFVQQKWGVRKSAFFCGFSVFFCDNPEEKRRYRCLLISSEFWP